MSTQPADPTASAASTEDKAPSQFTKPYRLLAAFVLLGANALFLLVALIDLVASDSSFTANAGAQFVRSFC